MDKSMIAYIVAMVALGIIALTLGFQPAYAGGYNDDPLHAQGANQAPTVLPMDASMKYTAPDGYIRDQLTISNYGLYYKLNMDPYHVGVSVEDDGSNEFAVEHFTEHVLETYWNYVNIENPGYNGYLEIAGFENMGGYIDQVYFIHAEARDARRMPISQFVEIAMEGYYADDYMGGYYEETYVTYPGDYYISRTSYGGSGVILVDTYADLYGPGDSEILVTTQQDTADWNAPI